LIAEIGLAIAKTVLRNLPAETTDAGLFLFVGMLAMLSSDVAISAAGFILAGLASREVALRDGSENTLRELLMGYT
jgi:hypothetical protein